MASTLQQYIQRVLEDEQLAKVQPRPIAVEDQEDRVMDAFSEAIDAHPVGRPMRTKVHRDPDSKR